MSDAVELWEKPQAEEIYMLAGWRQWADAGSISSGLPQYLIQRTSAEQIGEIRPDGFYLFQIPGTHHLVRPVIKFDEGFPEALQSSRNELYYAGDEKRGLAILLGDEPHLDIERYIGAMIHTAETLGAKRIISFGGVYGELPYDKERMVSCVYSLPHLKEEVEALAVDLSDYQGGSSVGSYLCKRASERNIEHVGFYGFVPTYDFSSVSQIANTIRIENDFMAWFGVMRRLNFMLKLNIDLTDLERKSRRLIELMDSKVEELEGIDSDLGVRAYLQRLSDEFTEVTFNPLDEIWEEELRRLSDKFEQSDE